MKLEGSPSTLEDLLPALKAKAALVVLDNYESVACDAARDLLDEPSVATNANALTAALHEIEKAQEQADALYQRWAELTEKAE